MVVTRTSPVQICVGLFVLSRNLLYSFSKRAAHAVAAHQGTGPGRRKKRANAKKKTIRKGHDLKHNIKDYDQIYDAVQAIKEAKAKG